MPTILSTKKLEKHQESLLLNAGISYVSYNAIHVSFIRDFNFPKEVKNAIITSKNTWKAIKNKLSIQNAFVVGKNTTQLLNENNVKIVESSDYGIDLAQQIIKNHSQKEFYFFCGNKRRNEIPQLLNEKSISFIEIQVYDTLENHKTFKQEFDGVLFFSPSAVQSFIQLNSLKNTIAFCIGTTTAKEVEKYTNNIIIANQPTIENVIVQVVKKYKND